MVNKQYEQILETIKALDEEIRPIQKKVMEFKSILDNTPIESKQFPLLDLMFRLTKTSRRHDLNGKVSLSDNYYGDNQPKERVVGTNHQGIGFVYSYASQLTSICYEHNSWEWEQKLKDILFDDNAVINLVSILKKSNQKTFLKAVKILKKYNYKISLGQHLEKYRTKIKIPIIDDKLHFNLVMNYRENSLNLNSENENDLGGYEIAISDDKITSVEEVKELQGISKHKLRSNIQLYNLKFVYYVLENKDKIISFIDEKIKEVDKIKKQYEGEHKEINDLLKPLLALDKI